MKKIIIIIICLWALLGSILTHFTNQTNNILYEDDNLSYSEKVLTSFDWYLADTWSEGEYYYYATDIEEDENIYTITIEIIDISEFDMDDERYGFCEKTETVYLKCAIPKPVTFFNNTTYVDETSLDYFDNCIEAFIYSDSFTKNWSELKEEGMNCEK